MAMANSTALQGVAEGIAAATGARCACAPLPERTVCGGSINQCYLWRCDTRPMFVKLADRAHFAMLEAEAAGLRELAAAQALRVPQVLAIGCAEWSAFLALEWIETTAPVRGTEQRLGERLAAQHRVSAPAFGWHRDNTIGRTPQLNGWLSDWVEFVRERRLRYQLSLATKNGFGNLLQGVGERLLESVGDLLARHQPQPSLLHGDLWGGNWFADSHGEPVVFDPAVYFGDREADLAMTHLFGGFGRAFYQAYEAEAPLAAGAGTRCELYNLYHVLNHANLFGGGYARQARAMIDRLLSQV